MPEIDKYKSLKELAMRVISETLHEPITTKTTMDLAVGVLALIQELEQTENTRLSQFHCDPDQ